MAHIMLKKYGPIKFLYQDIKFRHEHFRKIPSAREKILNIIRIFRILKILNTIPVLQYEISFENIF